MPTDKKILPKRLKSNSSFRIVSKYLTAEAVGLPAILAVCVIILSALVITQ
jgi:hypothetical protein